jgi:hypothetical protein
MLSLNTYYQQALPWHTLRRKKRLTAILILATSRLVSERAAKIPPVHTANIS